MLNHLDNLLRDLFLTHVDGLTDEAQIRFQPPDEVWRTYVSSLSVGGQPANALNVYMVDMRENRKLRSNARVNRPENGWMNKEPAPARVDFHYVISAWSPTDVTPATEPTLDEHVLLYNTAAVLMQNAPINPSRIYPPGSAALLAVPEIIQNCDLPTQILPAEGFAKLAEFWGTMGANYRWKPVIYMVVTLPVVLLTEVAGPMVTTMITEYRQTGQPGSAEVWIDIGGHVLDTLNPQPDGSPTPVSAAWVRLETTSGDPLQTTETNALGRFQFGRLQPGQYQLNWRADGHAIPTAPRTIDVPAPSGEYDLRFE